MAEKSDPAKAGKLEGPGRRPESPPARVAEVLQLCGAETLVCPGAGIGVETQALVVEKPRA